MKTTIERDMSRFDAALNDVIDLVAATIGPNGGNVSIAGHGMARALSAGQHLQDGEHCLTFDDGKKAVQHYVPYDPIGYEAARRVYDAQLAQIAACGDGTSTTAVLLGAVYAAGKRAVAQGVPERDVIRSFSKLADMTTEYLGSIAKGVGSDVIDADLIIKVATLAMHGDKELGATIGGLVAEMGQYGMLSVEPGLGNKVEVSRSTGYAWRKGVVDNVFFNLNGQARFDDCMVVIVNEVCNDAQSPFWQKVFRMWVEEYDRFRAATGNELGLVLISRGAQGSIMSTFAKQTLRGHKVPMLLLQCPGDDDKEAGLMLGDIAAVTGATVFDSVRGRLANESVVLNDIGRIAGVSATAKSTTLKLAEKVSVGLADIDADMLRKQRIADIEAEYDAEGAKDDMAMQEQKKRRISNLNGGVGIIKVPLSSQTNLSEMSETLEDGYLAATSALDGVLPGAGKGLYMAGYYIREMAKRADVDLPSVVCDCFADALQIVESLIMGETPRVKQYFDEVWLVRDAATGEWGDAVDMGVIDSLNVVKFALRNAMSVAMPLLNTKVLLVRGA